MRPTRRARIDLNLHLSITLDGDPVDRTAAYNAFLDDVVETIERMGARYYLHTERGEAVTAKVAEECDVTDLPGQEPAPARRRAGTGRRRPTGSSRGAPAAGGEGAGPAPTGSAPPAEDGETGSRSPSRAGLRLV